MNESNLRLIVGKNTAHWQRTSAYHKFILKICEERGL